MTSVKLVGVWILGGILLLLGSLIMTNLKLGSPGVSEFNLILSSVLALILFLGAGICWISVSVATRHA